MTIEMLSIVKLLLLSLLDFVLEKVLEKLSLVVIGKMYTLFQLGEHLQTSECGVNSRTEWVKYL